VSIENEQDAALAAISRLASAAVNEVCGDDAVKIVFNDPRDLKELKSEQLPALCIYRQSERRVRETEMDLTQVITVAFEYTMPQTDAAKRVTRWPALSIIWNAIVDTLADGQHSFIVDDDGEIIPVMTLAQSEAIDDSPSVNYGFADHGGVSNPHFLGTIVVYHRPDEVDAASFANFLRMYTGYYLPNTPAEDMTDGQFPPPGHPEPNPDRRAETIITLEAAD
jgi:hypothetical protein